MGPIFVATLFANVCGELSQSIYAVNVKSNLQMSIQICKRTEICERVMTFVHVYPNVGM